MEAGVAAKKLAVLRRRRHRGKENLGCGKGARDGAPPALPGLGELYLMEMKTRGPLPATPTAGAIAKIYAVIRRIPPGRVATYGQVAALAGLPRRARMVGAALRNTPDDVSLPWQRVINAQGTISARGGLGVEEGYQRHLLEEEGIRFDERGRIDLERFGWEPEAKPRGKGCGVGNDRQ
jgi:methylated-DNA-protein-cysteine methyltransferase related protein